MILSTQLRVAVAASAAFALAIGVTSCSSPSASAPSSGPVKIDGIGAIAVDDELQKLLPDGYAGGTISVATNAPFAPYEMFASSSDKTLVGLEPDLGHAIGALLDVRFEFHQQPFDGLIPGVQAGKYDVVMASLFDTREREEVVDMVNYSASGSGILVAAGNPNGYTTSSDLCGASVAVQTGSAQVGIVEGFADACVSDGEAPVIVVPYPQYSDELLALSTGQVSAVVGDIPAMSYSIAQKENAGRIELIIEPDLPNGYESAPVGIAVSKDSGLTDAVAAAVTQLMADGTYEMILEKWNVEDIAIDEVTVNAADSR